MKKLFASVALLSLVATGAMAAETVGEKTESAVNKIERKTKKGAHRVEEALCMEGDLKCAAEKAKHRAQEAGEALGDQAKKAKDTVD